MRPGGLQEEGREGDIPCIAPVETALLIELALRNAYAYS
jgi:hypothetical protein